MSEPKRARDRTLKRAPRGAARVRFQPLFIYAATTSRASKTIMTPLPVPAASAAIPTGSAGTEWRWRIRSNYIGVDAVCHLELAAFHRPAGGDRSLEPSGNTSCVLCSTILLTSRALPMMTLHTIAIARSGSRFCPFSGAGESARKPSLN